MQQHFIYCRGESAQTALDKLDEFFKAHFPDGGAEAGRRATVENDDEKKKGDESPDENSNSTSEEMVEKKIYESE